MGLVAGTGMSQHPSVEVAAQQAVAAALDKLQGQQPDLALVFASVEYAQDQLLSELKRRLPATTQLLGCSAAGELTELGFDKKSVAIMLLSVPQNSLATVVSELDVEKGQEVGQDFGKRLSQKLGAEPQIACFFTDGLAGDGAEIIEGLHHALPGLTKLAGGAAGDDLYFRKTYQYAEEKVLSSRMVGFGLKGQSIRAGVALAHGWQNLGMSRQITKVKGSQIIEIDGQPAVNFYETYFGKDNVDKLRRESLARLAITYPLGVRSGATENWLVRYPLSVDEHGALLCGAAVPKGATVDLMVGGRDELIAAAKSATEQALAQLNGATPKAAIIFDSVARSRLLGLHIDDEMDTIQTVLGGNVPTIGFASYAEFGPALVDNKLTSVSYQNESMAIMILGEI